jgi:hypothetical protein
MFECQDLKHEGERTGENVVQGHGTKCKICKSRDTRERNRKQQEEKEEQKKGRFQTAQDWVEFNKNMYGGKKYITPITQEFAISEEYDKAVIIDQKRKEDAKKQYMETEKEKRQQEALKNILSEAEIEEKKEKAKRRKLDIDNARKAEKYKQDIPAGMGLCRTGPHLVQLEEIQFCPVADLGISYNGPSGSILRNYCKKHFEGYLNASRKHNDKPERREYNREGLVEYRKTEKYREYAQDYEVLKQRRITSMKQSAKHRNIAYRLSNAKEQEIVKAQAICHYCNRRNKSSARGLYKDDINSVETPLGPDRIDCTKEYTDDNVVPCCNQCNISKCQLSTEEFVNACYKVITFYDTGIPNDSFQMIKKNNCKSVTSFAKYKERAYGRKLTFELTPEQYESFKNGACYYCGLKDGQHIGIDRFDNDKGYTMENMKSCCSACNYMKNHFSYDDFLEMCRCVTNKH